MIKSNNQEGTYKMLENKISDFIKTLGTYIIYTNISYCSTWDGVSFHGYLKIKKLVSYNIYSVFDYSCTSYRTYKLSYTNVYGYVFNNFHAYQLNTSLIKESSAKIIEERRPK